MEFTFPVMTQDRWVGEMLFQAIRNIALPDIHDMRGLPSMPDNIHAVLVDRLQIQATERTPNVAFAL